MVVYFPQLGGIGPSGKASRTVVARWSSIRLQPRSQGQVGRVGGFRVVEVRVRKGIGEFEGLGS